MCAGLQQAVLLSLLIFFELRACLEKRKYANIEPDETKNLVQATPSDDPKFENNATATDDTEQYLQQQKAQHYGAI